MKALWLVVAACCLCGFYQAIVVVSHATSAPQQAAGAAMGIAWAVIPYCLVKAITSLLPVEVIVKKEQSD